MTTISVSASKKYDVLIESGIRTQLGTYALNIVKGRNAAIISDSNVWPIYGQEITESLANAGFHCFSFVFPAGESSKNGETYLEILNFLSENKISRSDLLVALGGGVVGDITGFAAATYLRGISFVQMPTTLLSMVDSSVGGKTAIDLKAGKNLAGAFYQPRLVLCDIETLNTLPLDIFRDGCAEVIKYGVLYDEQLFHHLENTGLAFDRSHVISRCIALKRDVVAEDEFDTGSRQKLNLGHTIGHGIEANSHYTISHGQAVAIGMAIITKASAQYGYCNSSLADKIVDILNKFALPTKTCYSADELFLSALSDKKRAGTHVNLIIPRTIGKCDIISTPTTDLKAFIQAGL